MFIFIRNNTGYKQLTSLKVRQQHFKPIMSTKLYPIKRSFSLWGNCWALPALKLKMPEPIVQLYSNSKVHEARQYTGHLPYSWDWTCRKTVHKAWQKKLKLTPLNHIHKLLIKIQNLRNSTLSGTIDIQLFLH